jgi:hypothetical protein
MWLAKIKVLGGTDYVSDYVYINPKRVVFVREVVPDKSSEILLEGNVKVYADETIEAVLIKFGQRESIVNES